MNNGVSMAEVKNVDDGEWSEWRGRRLTMVAGHQPRRKCLGKLDVIGRKLLIGHPWAELVHVPSFLFRLDYLSIRRVEVPLVDCSTAC
jgi:hypothetical protein